MDFKGKYLISQHKLWHLDYEKVNILRLFKISQEIIKRHSHLVG